VREKRDETVDGRRQLNSRSRVATVTTDSLSALVEAMGGIVPSRPDLAFMGDDMFSVRLLPADFGEDAAEVCGVRVRLRSFGPPPEDESDVDENGEDGMSVPAPRASLPTPDGDGV